MDGGKFKVFTITRKNCSAGKECSILVTFDRSTHTLNLRFSWKLALKKGCSTIVMKTKLFLAGRVIEP